MKAKSKAPTKQAPQNNASRVIKPPHYIFQCEDTKGNIVELEVRNVAEALFSQDLHIGTAWIYLARAGHKAGSSYLEDVRKAVQWLKFGIEHHDK